MGRNVRPPVQPISSKGVPRANVPYLIEIEPPAVVAAGATVTVNYTVGPRDFVCKGMGFTASAVGIPPAGQYFKIGILDIGSSIRFQPHRWHVTAFTGVNPAAADKEWTEWPEEAPWIFEHQTTISVEFENIGAIACLPTLVLVGYLS